MAFTEDIHIKMCKKIAQLTKVIYNLNSKSEESESIIDSMKKEYKNNITRIMEESKQQVQLWKSKYQEHENYEKELEQYLKGFEELKNHNRFLQKTINESSEKSMLNEKHLKSDYENKLLDLQNKLLERKREYNETIERFQVLQKKLEATKQGKIANISKQNEEMEKLKDKHATDVRKHKEQLQDLQNEITCLKDENSSNKQHWDNKVHQIRTENEENIQKLKLLHDKELQSVRSQIKTSELEQLTMEKLDLNNNFEMKKVEFTNRIRFLENSLHKLENENDDLKNNVDNAKTLCCKLQEELSNSRQQLCIKQEEFQKVVQEKAQMEDVNSNQTKMFDVLQKEFKGLFFFLSFRRCYNLGELFFAFTVLCICCFYKITFFIENLLFYRFAIIPGKPKENIGCIKTK